MYAARQIGLSWEGGGCVRDRTGGRNGTLVEILTSSETMVIARNLPEDIKKKESKEAESFTESVLG